MTEQSTIPARKRRWPIWLAGLLLLWGGGWFAGKAILQHELMKARADLAEQGTTITCDKEDWGGFPLRYTFNCTNPLLKAGKATPHLQVKAENLTLAMWFPWPLATSAVLTGPTSIDDEIINHAPAKGSLSFGLTGNWSTAVKVPQPSYAPLGHAEEVTLGVIKSTGKITVQADAQAIVVTPADAPPLVIDTAKAKAETDARLADAEHPADLMAAGAIPLKIDELQLVSGAATVTASGEFTLDASHKLNGKLASTVNDIDVLMALIAPLLKLEEGEVAAAKTVIGLIGGDPNSKARKLDVIAKQGELYWGPFKIADVPPIE